MKVATLCSETVAAEPVALPRSRVADYLELTKPRVAVLVLFTVAAGVLLGGAGRALDGMVLLHTLLGTALVAAGASALNQLLERHSDALMTRTANRPLPSGRLQPAEVLVFGLGLGVAGVLYLALTLSQPTAALVAALTFVCYVGVYTPLKPLTPLNTLVGAVPGALPPIIGWTAARGEVTADALALFFMLFFWQVPHFLAIAWIYREQYARAGLCMLPVVDPDGRRTGRQMVAYCLALIAVSLAPVVLGSAGLVYLIGALLLGGGFLATTLLFRRETGVPQARRVLRASLLYLPGVLALLLLEGLLPGR
jgi:protoheme IX farnesyltransferase